MAERRRQEAPEVAGSIHAHAALQTGRKAELKRGVSTRLPPGRSATRGGESARRGL